jgi:hypothetical protein
MSTDRPRRLRRAISLKWLLLLVLIWGVFLGWRVNRARTQRRVVQAVRNPGVTFHYDWQFVGGTYRPRRKPPGPDWLRRFLGNEYFKEVTHAGIADTSPMNPENKSGRRIDRVLADLRALDRLRELTINGRQLRDGDLARIRGLTALEKLEIDGARNLTDAGVSHLRGIDHLRSIAITDCTLTDASLDQLAEIPALEELDLRGNRLTDAGLHKLSRLPHLRSLRPGWGATRLPTEGWSRSGISGASRSWTSRTRKSAMRD